MEKMCTSKKTMEKPVSNSLEMKTLALNIQPTFRIRWIIFAKKFFADCEEWPDIERCMSLKDDIKSKMALTDLLMGLDLNNFMLSQRLYGYAKSDVIQEFYSNIKVLSVIKGVLKGDNSAQKKSVVKELLKAINELHYVSGPKKFFEFKLHNDLGFFLALFENKAMAKENLKRSKAIYDKIVNQKENERQSFVRWMQWKDLEFKEALNVEHLAMIENYFLYYQTIGNHQKEIQNGMLALKYLVHYDRIDQDSRFLFAAYAIDISSACIKQNALAQSYYVLRAASHVLDKFSSDKSKLFTQDVISCIKADLKMAYVQHLLNLIVVSSQQTEKVKNIDLSVTKIDRLQVPDGNELHARLLKTKAEAAKVYTKAKNTIKVVQKYSHYDEWLVLNTLNTLKKVTELVQTFPK